MSMEEKNNQQNKETDKVYTAGEVGSLLENINDGIKVIAEDQSSIKKGIEGIKETIIKIEGKLDAKAEKEAIDDHEQRIVELEKVAARA